MHDTESKGKFRESAARMEVQTPCSAVIQYDLHSFYTQRLPPLEAIGRISRDRHSGRHCLPFELHRIRAGRNASVSSALEDPAGSSCMVCQRAMETAHHRTYESRASVNLCSK